MRKFWEFAAWGFFGTIALVIIFVKAGKGGGQSGGQQTAEIAQAAGSSLSQLAAALEGGGA